MKLRSKILISLVSVGVIPLVVALWVVGDMVLNELEAQVKVRSTDSIIFIEQTTTNMSSEELTLIETIANSRRIVPYLDMPLQHINDTMLRRMSRRVTRGETLRLLDPTSCERRIRQWVAMGCMG